MPDTSAGMFKGLIRMTLKLRLKPVKQFNNSTVVIAANTYTDVGGRVESGTETEAAIQSNNERCKRTINTGCWYSLA